MNTSGSYFDANGQPLPEAEPFFVFLEGSDDPAPGPEFNARKLACWGKPGIFDDDLILQSLVEGWSVEETCLRGLEVEAELQGNRE